MPCAAAGPSTAGAGLAAAATLTAVNEEMASTEHSAAARTTSLRIIDASRTTRPHRTPRPDQPHLPDARPAAAVDIPPKSSKSAAGPRPGSPCLQHRDLPAETALQPVPVTRRLSHAGYSPPDRIAHFTDTAHPSEGTMSARHRLHPVRHRDHVRAHIALYSPQSGTYSCAVECLFAKDEALRPICPRPRRRRVWPCARISDKSGAGPTQYRCQETGGMP